MKVLLVEDNDDLRHLFARVLRKRSCTVCEAENGCVALRLVREFEPQLIITDLMMPELDGIQLITLLKHSPATADIPVVAITADMTPEMEQRARMAGAADFIEKPLDIPTLLERISLYTGP